MSIDCRHRGILPVFRRQSSSFLKIRIDGKHFNVWELYVQYVHVSNCSPRDKPEAEDEDGGEPDDPVGGPHRDSDGGGGRRLFPARVSPSSSSSAPLPAPQNPAAPAHLVFPLGDLGKISFF